MHYMRVYKEFRSDIRTILHLSHSHNNSFQALELKKILIKMTYLYCTHNL